MYSAARMDDFHIPARQDNEPAFVPHWVSKKMLQGVAAKAHTEVVDDSSDSDEDGYIEFSNGRFWVNKDENEEDGDYEVEENGKGVDIDFASRSRQQHHTITSTFHAIEDEDEGEEDGCEEDEEDGCEDESRLEHIPTSRCVYRQSFNRYT